MLVHHSTTFIGIDLAWRSEKNHSGIVVAKGDRSGARFKICLHDIMSPQKVVGCITDYSSPNTVIAVDAPLIIKNAVGQRPCEKLIGQKFGKHHASAHSSNLALYPDPGGVGLAAALKEAGFSHYLNPATDKLRGGRWFFEVYPHAGQVVLFNLEKTIKYKKGRVAERRKGLRELRQHLEERLPRADPPFCLNEVFEGLLGEDVEALKGKALKRYEDVLDACFCAYLAMFYWRWGGEKNEMIGDLESGYIINPTEPLCEKHAA